MGGAGSLPGDDGWVSLALADTAPLLLPASPGNATDFTPLHASVLRALGQGQAMFFRGIAEAVGRDDELARSLDDAALAAAVWDLVWAGELTNDTLAPLRSRLGAARTSTRRASGSTRGRYAGRPRRRMPHAHRPAGDGRPLVAAARSASPTPPAGCTRWPRRCSTATAW